MTITNTVSVSEARANFTKIGRQVSETRKPVTVFKGSTPYLVISPAPIAGPISTSKLTIIVTKSSIVYLRNKV